MSASTCRGCGQPLNAALPFCPNCGINTASMRIQQPATAAAVAHGAQAVGYAPEPQPVQIDPAPASVPSSYPIQEAKRNETRRIVLAAVSILLITLIARVAFAAANPKPDGELVAELPVDSQGGSVEFGDGGKLTVPKGAVSKPTNIQIRRNVMRDQIRGVSPTGGTPLIIPPGTVFVYFFTPVNVQFLVPVTLTLPVIGAPGTGLVFVSANGRITFLQGTQRGRNITVQLTSFDFSRGQQVFVNRR